MVVLKRVEKPITTALFGKRKWGVYPLFASFL
jgi:hypothetical protein